MLIYGVLPGCFSRLSQTWIYCMVMINLRQFHAACHSRSVQERSAHSDAYIVSLSQTSRPSLAVQVVGDLAQFMVQNELTEKELVDRAETLDFPSRCS